MSRYLFAKPDGMILVILRSGGEMISCLLMSFKVIYSSKSILSSRMSRGTFTLEVSIFEPTTCGGKVSLSPPTGDPTRAHEKSRRLRKRKTTFFIKKVFAQK